jgi:hypothetical protein
MRRICVGTALSLLAISLAGCGETQEEGPVSYKGTNSPGIEKLRDGMSDNVKNKVGMTKGGEDKSAAKKDKDKDKEKDKDAEKKSGAAPAADTKK